jgi:dTDP-4-amino-4,6-dideoxygalactose transaminase
MEDLTPLFEGVLQSGTASNFGPLVSAFEKAAASAFFADDSVACVATSSGTTAIEIAIQALDLPPASEILIPAFGFCATAAVVTRLGHVPIFADVDSARWEITVDNADQCLRRRNIAAVLAVSPFGYPFDTETWASWSSDNGIPVILDAAAGLGNQTRCHGLTVTFSMHATKPFAVGEGGLIVVANEAKAQELRARCNFGMINRVAHFSGGNAKLSEWHGAIAIAQLRRWSDITSAIGQVRKLYQESLGHLPLRFHPGAWTSPTAAFMPVGFADETSACGVMAVLSDVGIEARRWFYPVLADHPVYRVWALDQTNDIHEARFIAATTVCLPLHSFIQERDVNAIAKAIEKIV